MSHQHHHTFYNNFIEGNIRNDAKQYLGITVVNINATGLMHME